MDGPRRPEGIANRDFESVQSDEVKLGRCQKVRGADLIYDVNQWREGGGVLLTTMRSFKGLEADVIVLIDLPKPGSMAACTVADFYVGCSRAKHILKVISTESEGDLLGGFDR